MQISNPMKPRPPGARKQTGGKSEAPITHGYVKSFDGTKLFYSSEGQGDPIVFCYGLVCSSLHWTYQIEYLRKNYRTIWFDYRGHQNSEIPHDLSSLTLGNIARDLGIVLDELGIREATLLGHSMGVNVALEYYRQNPTRVVGLVLANGAAQRPLETLFRHNGFQAGFKLFRKLYRKSPVLMESIWKSQKRNPLVRMLVTVGGFNPHLTPQKDIELYIDQVVETDPRIFMELIDNYDSCDAGSWLHTINVPTLIVAGQDDKLIPIEQQELMHQLIPNSQLEVIRHGSHCPQMDLPDLVNMKIERFLSTVHYSLASNPPTESASQSTETQATPHSLTLE